MTNADIHQVLTTVFRQIFDDEALEITPQTTAKDVADWDSINHINLIVAVEKRFKISLTTKEAQTLANVGALMELIARRVAQ